MRYVILFVMCSLIAGCGGPYLGSPPAGQTDPGGRWELEAGSDYHRCRGVQGVFGARIFNVQGVATPVDICVPFQRIDIDRFGEKAYATDAGLFAFTANERVADAEFWIEIQFREQDHMPARLAIDTSLGRPATFQRAFFSYRETRGGVTVSSQSVRGTVQLFTTSPTLIRGTFTDIEIEVNGGQRLITDGFFEIEY